MLADSRFLRRQSRSRRRRQAIWRRGFFGQPDLSLPPEICIKGKDSRGNRTALCAKLRGNQTAMQTKLFIIVGAVALCATLRAAETNSITTRDGITYTNAVIQRAD